MSPFEVLDEEQVVRINRDILHSATGEKGAILLPGNLSLAVDTPNRTLFGVEAFPSLNEKAAALFHELSKLHPFVNGNKRTAFAAADTLLRINGWKVLAPLGEAVDVSLRTAQCLVNIEDLSGWIGAHMVVA